MRKIVKFLFIATFIGSLIFSAVESTPLDNTLGGIRLFWIGCASGALVALIFSPWLLHIFFYEEPRSERVALTFMLVVSFGLTVADMASYLNRSLSPNTITVETHKILWKGHDNKHSQFYLGIQTITGEERIQVRRKFWETVTDNANIKLSIVPGFLGFQYVVGSELAP